MVAGAGEPLARMLAGIVFDAPEAAGVPLAVSGRFASPHDSALYNGALAHAIDYDDVTHPAYAHPGASIVPAILATAHFECVSGSEALTAYIVGIEMVSKLGRALNTAHYKNGWHASGPFGTIGAAATAARRRQRVERHAGRGQVVAADQREAPPVFHRVTVVALAGDLLHLLDRALHEASVRTRTTGMLLCPCRSRTGTSSQRASKMNC